MCVYMLVTVAASYFVVAAPQRQLETYDRQELLVSHHWQELLVSQHCDRLNLLCCIVVTKLYSDKMSFAVYVLRLGLPCI